jgi:predicted naringenin-chalcone synthase
VRDLRLVDEFNVEVEGFRSSGDRVLFLCSGIWDLSIGFRRRGEIVRARSSAVVSLEIGVELCSLEARRVERRASIMSEVLSMERPRTWRSSGWDSFVSASRVGEAG